MTCQVNCLLSTFLLTSNNNDNYSILLCQVIVAMNVTSCNIKWHIKTYGSESWGQEEAGLHDEPVSYLHIALL